MRVKINNQSVELPDGTTIRAIADERKLPEKGVAVAVNNVMVPREEWTERVLNDGDDIVILKAFCGG